MAKKGVGVQKKIQNIINGISLIFGIWVDGVIEKNFIASTEENNSILISLLNDPIDNTV